MNNTTSTFTILSKGSHTVCTQSPDYYLACEYKIIGTKEIEHSAAFAHLHIIGKAVRLLRRADGFWIVSGRVIVFNDKTETAGSEAGNCELWVCKEILKEVLDILYKNSSIVRSNKPIGRRAAENAILKHIA